ncbi:hypothetical protein J7E49_26025 [Variovorax paradoxus]|nr:hypothetical protein [Variovorax paradoxus]
MNSDNLPDLVRIARIDDLEALVCHIRQSSTDSVIASELSDSLDLDGFCILPTKTIRYFDRAFDKAEFYQAALGAWKTVDDAELLKEFSCNMVLDLQMLARKGATVAIHMEIDDPDVCFIGVPRDVTSAGLLLDKISARGLRISQPLEVKMDEITKVEFETRYLRAVGHAARWLEAND